MSVAFALRSDKPENLALRDLTFVMPRGVWLSARDEESKGIPHPRKNIGQTNDVSLIKRIVCRGGVKNGGFRGDGGCKSEVNVLKYTERRFLAAENAVRRGQTPEP